MNDFSFKKKNSDSKEKIELKAEKEKNLPKDIVSALEEDLNEYYSKNNKKNEVEKKFMKIQNAFIKKDEPASSSMKNIFSSVKKLFS